jgi:hypothetical protein
MPVRNRNHGHPSQDLLNNLFRHPYTKIEFIDYVRMANVCLSCSPSILLMVAGSRVSHSQITTTVRAKVVLDY